jgi:HlyD family secretion protein
MALSKKSIFSILFPVLLCLVAVLYFTAMRNDAAAVVLEKKPAQTGDIQATVTATGTLNPVTLVDVGTQVSGRISAIDVDFNEVVKRGQVLAEIDQRPFLMKVRQAEAELKIAQAALEKARAQLDTAENQYERGTALFEKSLISVEEKEALEAAYLGAKADLIGARSGLTQAQAQASTAEVNLSYTVIRSPLDGIVINRAVNVGQTVAARVSAPVLFQIADSLKNLRVECNIQESDVGMVRKGDAATFTVDAYPDVPFKGVVSQVRFASQQVNNVVTYTAVIEVENPGRRLLPRMTADVVINVGSAHNVLVVPNAALRFLPPSDLANLISVDWGRGSGFHGGPLAEQEGAVPMAENRMGPDGGDPVIRSLWVEDENGAIHRVLIRPGLSDATKTEVREVVSGELKAGDELVIRAQTPETERASRLTPRDVRRARHYLR